MREHLDSCSHCIEIHNVAARFWGTELYKPHRHKAPLKGAYIITYMPRDQILILNAFPKRGWCPIEIEKNKDVAPSKDARDAKQAAPDMDDEIEEVVFLLQKDGTVKKSKGQDRYTGHKLYRNIKRVKTGRWSYYRSIYVSQQNFKRGR